MDHMIGSMSTSFELSDSLIDRWAYLVRVSGFTFQFVSLTQVRDCLDHFSKKIHSSGRLEKPPLSHWYYPWHERLPMWLFEEPKRLKVVAALSKALLDFEADA